MTTTPYMGIVLPTAGDAGAGSWDDDIDSAFEDRIDGHRHVSGEGRQIPSAGIGIDANLTFAGWIPTNVGAIGFAERIAAASPAIPNQSLWVNSVNDDLYFRSSGGTDNRLTAGGVLNVAIVGGIVGDYAASGAVFSYDDANKRYKAMRSSGPDYWASVAMGDLELLEKASGISNKVTLKSPAALAASYTVTFPAAVPASTVAVQSSSAGVLTFSNTFTTLITASAGVTAAAGQHVTVSGAGEYKHGDKTVTITPILLYAGSWVSSLNTSYVSSTNGNACNVALPPFIVGDRIKSVTIAVQGDGAADLDWIVRKTTSAMVDSAIGSTETVTDQPASWSDSTSNVTDTVAAAGDVFYLNLDPSAVGIIVGSIRVTFDHP